MSRSTRRRSLPALITTVLAATAASAALAPPAAAAPRAYDEYVALGDSWTADVVIVGTAGHFTAQYVPLDCAQSTFDYPKQVAAKLGVPAFFDASCGSATSEHFESPQTGLPLGGTNPPQFSHLTKNTDLVTVGIGGNDIGLAAAITPCINVLPSLTVVPGFALPAPLGGSCRPGPGETDPIDEALATQEPLITKRIEAITPLVADDARIVMVNYIAGVPPRGCWPYVPISNEDVPWIYEKFTALNAMVERIADNAGVELVDAYSDTLGHDVCTSPFTRYVEAVIPLSLNAPAVAIPFHPNSAGAKAQAQSVLAHLAGASTGPASGVE
jgi:lysophospholipase L1-like esterase